MTTYNWSTLTNNQIVPFVPGADALHFDDPTISAADLSWTFGDTGSPTDPNGNFTLSVGGKTVKFGIVSTTPAPFAYITTNNVTFADGSRFIVGDNALGGGNDDLPNTLTGGNGDDALFGLGGNDTMTGGLGNDNFWVAFSTTGIGNDSIDGGDGLDSLIYNSGSPTATTVNLSGAFNVIAAHTATNAQGTATLVSIETVLGTAGVDTFIGGDPAHGIDSLGNRIGERFRGNNGNDTITGGSGVDFFTTADYANNSAAQAVTANLRTGSVSDGRGFTDMLINVDALRGGAGNDNFTGGSLSRGASSIFFESFRGNGGNDTFNGDNANSDGPDASADRADYSNNTSAQAINVNMNTGIVLDGLGGTDTLTDIDEVYGGAGNDTFLGDAGRNRFDGGPGNDTLNGGAGQDRADFQQSTARVIVNMSTGSITVGAVTVTAGTANDGMGGTDTLLGIESVRASDFADYIRGSDDVNVRQYLQGDAGNDTFDGGAGVDFAAYGSNPISLGGLTAFIENGAGSVVDRRGGTDTLINIEGLTGTHTADTLTGGLGDQWFLGNGGNDSINGGSGSDWVTYEFDPKGVTINLGNGTATDGWNGAAGLLALGGVDTLVSIENAEGSQYVDTIVGNASGNVLRGLGNNDNINGGLGYDTAGFSGTPGAYSITRNGLTTTVSGPDGTDTLTSIELLQFDGGGVRSLEHADRDFGDNGKSDILWRNTNGSVAVWQMDGFTQSNGAIVGTATTDWKIADGSGDYDGNGKSDLLWLNDNGLVAIWQMDGLIVSGGLTFSSVSAGWKIADGAGDYNADGKSDILLRHDNGNLGMWLMDGLAIASGLTFSNASADWKIADGAGDYNGDGKSDILWRNDNGNVAVWLMDGFNQTAGAIVSSASTDWKIADGSGDYNEDGKSDILFHNDNGNVAIWQMDGLNINGASTFSNTSPGWKIADGSGDHNGDGRSDILLHHANGNMGMWLMDGMVVATGSTFSNASVDWAIPG